MNIQESKARFDYWFPELTEKKAVADDGKKVQAGKVVKDKCPDCKKPMAECECENAMKADAKGKKSKNKMDSVQAPAGAAAPAPAAAAPKPMAAKNGKKADKKADKKVKESFATAKIVYGLKEGESVKRYSIEKESVGAALASAKRMVKTKDLSTVSFIDVVDVKQGLTKTIYETLENYKSRKRAFETHVVCSECSSPELELSPKKTKIRCKRCGTEDLVENIDGVK